jgi:hypothetical protein
MRRAIAALAVFSACAFAQSATTPPSAPSPAIAAHRTLLNAYCITCHNQKLRTAGLTLNQADISRVPQNAEL